MIQVGDVLRGKYRLESSIGRGGMGEVFCALDTQVNRRVAVKVVSRQIIGDILMARLQREAVAAVRVRSDYVPQLLDVDTTEEGEVFLVMELLRGQTLTARLKQRGNLTWDEMASVGADVLQGLIDAHAAGVIHRDLKPSNIFLELARPGSGERAKILDFGVCKLDAPDGEKLTTTGESVGTVAYMAPEQIRGASKVDQRADLYSFATVVFEALSGRMTHEAPGQMALLASKLERPSLRLASCTLVPVPEGLDALVARLLERNPDLRMSSATELLAAWQALGPATIEPQTQPFMTLEPDAERSPAPLGATQTSLTAGTGTMLRHGERPPSRVPLLVAAGAVAMSLGVFGAMIMARGSTPPVVAEKPVPATDEVTMFHASDTPAGETKPVELKAAGGTADEPGAPPPVTAAATASAGEWVTVSPSGEGAIPVVEFPGPTGDTPKRAAIDPNARADAGTSRSVRTGGRRYGTRPAQVGPTKRSATEPRIDDKPRY